MKSVNLRARWEYHLDNDHQHFLSTDPEALVQSPVSPNLHSPGHYRNNRADVSAPAKNEKEIHYDLL